MKLIAIFSLFAFTINLNSSFLLTTINPQQKMISSIQLPSTLSPDTSEIFTINLGQSDNTKQVLQYAEKYIQKKYLNSTRFGHIGYIYLNDKKYSVSRNIFGEIQIVNVITAELQELLKKILPEPQIVSEAPEVAPKLGLKKTKKLGNLSQLSQEKTAPDLSQILPADVLKQMQEHAISEEALLAYLKIFGLKKIDSKTISQTKKNKQNLTKILEIVEKDNSFEKDIEKLNQLFDQANESALSQFGIKLDKEDLYFEDLDTILTNFHDTQSVGFDQKTISEDWSKIKAIYDEIKNNLNNTPDEILKLKYIIIIICQHLPEQEEEFLINLFLKMTAEDLSANELQKQVDSLIPDIQNGEIDWIFNFQNLLQLRLNTIINTSSRYEKYMLLTETLGISFFEVTISQINKFILDYTEGIDAGLDFLINYAKKTMLSSDEVKNFDAVFYEFIINELNPESETLYSSHIIEYSNFPEIILKTKKQQTKLYATRLNKSILKKSISLNEAAIAPTAEQLTRKFLKKYPDYYSLRPYILLMFTNILKNFFHPTPDGIGKNKLHLFFVNMFDPAMTLDSKRAYFANYSSQNKLHSQIAIISQNLNNHPVQRILSVKDEINLPKLTNEIQDYLLANILDPNFIIYKMKGASIDEVAEKLVQDFIQQKNWISPNQTIINHTTQLMIKFLENFLDDHHTFSGLMTFMSSDKITLTQKEKIIKNLKKGIDEPIYNLFSSKKYENKITSIFDTITDYDMWLLDMLFPKEKMELLFDVLDAQDKEEIQKKKIITYAFVALSKLDLLTILNSSLCFKIFNLIVSLTPPETINLKLIANLYKSA
jgi:hypothetical protein